MAKAKTESGSSLRIKVKKKRAGRHSKKKTSSLKTSKCYKKLYKSQGR
jgi:hypothetical protein